MRSLKRKTDAVRKAAALFAAVFVLALSAALLAACGGTVASAKFEERAFSFGEGLKVGIVSDVHLGTGSFYDDTEKSNFEKAVRSFERSGVNMMIIAGDITQSGEAYGYALCESTVKKYYGDDMPLMQYVMGNHDYSCGSSSAQYYSEQFERMTGQSPWTHYTVNDYHFIGLSPVNGESGSTAPYSEVESELRSEIESAIADGGDKPVFVTTHHAPYMTVYGSDEWYADGLYDIFDDYPQVVSISGHSHYSILDERSIWFGDFTAVDTQSTAYTELESGKVNGTVPDDSYETPMGLIMEFGADEIGVIRMNFAKGEYGEEEKAGMRWVLPTETDQAYLSQKAALAGVGNSAPTMNGGAVSYSRDGDGYIVLSFGAGSDDDFVHSYKLVYDTGEEELYFSDFYNGISDMSQTVTLSTDKKNYAGEIKIRAVDSYGLVSADYVSVLIV